VRKKIESIRQQGFFLSVDGKKYGPFLEKHRAQYKDLHHRSGVTFTDVWLESGWVESTPTPKKPAKDKTCPLLEGIGFIPIVRGK
jgi:hypothetical protein